MVPRNRDLQTCVGLPGTPWREAASDAINAPVAVPAARPPRTTRAERRLSRRAFRAVSTVRSVQRLPRPEGADAIGVAQEYLRWLPRFMRPLLSTEREGSQIHIKFRFMRRPLLSLRFDPERSRDDRALFWVDGGLLAATPAQGRLEFRLAPKGRQLLAAIHEFVPRLPWFIYVATQALAHLFVMWRFGAHLRRTPPGAPGPPGPAQAKAARPTEVALPPGTRDL